MRFNTIGKACYGSYGVGGVSVDGAVPAPLAAQECGSPAWQSDTQLVYQDCTSGTCSIDRLTYPGLTTGTVLASGANIIAGGGGVWAAWYAGTTYTSYGGTYANSTLLTVSPEGQTAIVTDRSAGAGLTIYDETGASIYTDANVRLVNDKAVRLRSNILAYATMGGWNLIDIAVSSSLGWFPRPNVVLTVPITLGGLVYLLEQTNNEEGVSLRPSNKAKGWQLNSTAFAFNPDAIELAGNIRAGSCTSPGEGTTSLQVYDITVNSDGTLTMSIGTVSGGGIVYGPDATVNFRGYSVGPFIDGLGQRDLVANIAVPFEETHTGQNGKVTKPWVRFYTDLTSAVEKVGGAVEEIPTEPVSAGFDSVDVANQPSIEATSAQNNLTFQSGDGTVEFRTFPNVNAIDFSVPNTGGFAPVTTGAEPLVFVSNGAGQVLMTPYTP